MKSNSATVIDTALTPASEFLRYKAAKLFFRKIDLAVLEYRIEEPYQFKSNF